MTAATFVDAAQTQTQGSRGADEEPAAKRPCMDGLRIKRLTEFAVLPTRGSAGAAGYDLSSAYDYVIPARGKAMCKTDICMAIPGGHYGRVAPRSGLTWKHSLDTGAGVIDEDYRGELCVILFNHSDTDFQVSRGDRIAQLILERISTPEVLEVESLDDTDRGQGAFGSTGGFGKPLAAAAPGAQ